MRITHYNGTVSDIPKVRGIGGLLALGTCNVCNLSFADGRGILEHSSEDCSPEDREKNRGTIHVTLSVGRTH